MEFKPKNNKKLLFRFFGCLNDYSSLVLAVDQRIGLLFVFSLYVGKSVLELPHVCLREKLLFAVALFLNV
jgi:hypothetical protein